MDPINPDARPLPSLEDLVVGVVVMDARGSFRDVNQAAAEMLGYTRDELRGRDIRELTHPEDLAAPEVPTPKARRQRLRHKAGHYLLTESRGRLTEDGSCVAVIEDVTAREAAERRLRDSEERLRFLANAVPAVIGYVDTNVRYVWGNESYRRWFGRDPESMRGCHASEVLGPKAWEKVRPYAERALAGEEVSFEDRLVYSSGPDRDVRALYIPHRDATGRVRGFVGMIDDVTASKEAELALRRSERMLEESQKMAQVGSWEVTLQEDGRTEPGSVRWSDQTFRIYGHEPRAFAPSYEVFMAAVHPDDRSALRAASARGTQQEGRFEKEHRIVRPDGEVRVIHVWATVERGPGGSPRRMIGTSQDVTERKLAEAAVRQAREQLQTVVDTTPAMIARCDRERRIVWANRSYAARFGLTADEVAGRMLREIEGEQAYRSLEPAMDRVLAGETFELELEIPHRTLGPRWMHLVCSPTFNGAGIPDGWVAVLTDDTHRRELEVALRLGEERYRSLVGAITSVVWTADAGGSFAEVQPAWEKFTGQTWDQHQGWSWTAALHPDDRARITAHWRDCLGSGAAYRAATRVWHAASGAYRACEASAVAIRSPDGTIREWIGTLVDVHERERALEDLRQASRRKDEFLAMLSHELRNPLAPIMSAVETLNGRRLLPPEAIQKHHAVIARQAQHMKRMLDDLLDVSRVSQGKVRLHKEPLELGAMLLQAVEVSRPLLLAKQQKLSLTLAPGLLPLDGDPTRLVQVFANLLNNAAKYTEPGGHVLLHSAQVDGGAVVRVKDDGIGMSAELLERAFDLFVQDTSSLDRAQGGLGIGLTMVRSLVHMHGGTVQAFSDGPGRGSELVVKLPLAPTDSLRAEPDGAGAVVCPLRVLVVDDNVDAAQSMAALLETFGHQVLIAHDGPAALAAARASPPEMVLLDIGLPGMDGYEVAARLRDAGVDRGALVAVTGYGRAEDLERSSRAGFSHHLVKPVEVAVLQRIAARIASGAASHAADGAPPR